jgi:hypothetical protein
MERVLFGICFYISDYKRRCVSREFLAHNREEIVFLFATLHRVVVLYQGASPYRSCEAGELSGLGRIVRVLAFAGYCQK